MSPYSDIQLSMRRGAVSGSGFRHSAVGSQRLFDRRLAAEIPWLTQALARRSSDSSPHCSLRYSYPQLSEVKRGVLSRVHMPGYRRRRTTMQYCQTKRDSDSCKKWVAHGRERPRPAGCRAAAAALVAPAHVLRSKQVSASHVADTQRYVLGPNESSTDQFRISWGYQSGPKEKAT